MSARDFIEKDYYAALGVPKDASAAEIKKAYRTLARELHPDKNPGDSAAEARFKEVGEAYDVLADAQRRKEYDEARTLFAGGAGGVGGVPFDVGDLFGNAAGRARGGGGLGDLFGSFFSGGSSRGTGPRRGSDVETEATLDFTEAVTGVTLPLRLTSPHTCETCHGTRAAPGTTPRTCPTCSGLGLVTRNQGAFALSEPCRDCRGTGRVVDTPCPDCGGTGQTSRTRTITVRIPPGVHDGQRIRLNGKGSPGERGGPPGDLFVVVHVTPHQVFGRRGDDLTLTLPVTFPEAVLGATVSVPTLDGPLSIKVPPGTASGRTLRLRGKGVQRRDGVAGDLLVTVEVAVPQRLSDEARAALETYAAAAPDDPRTHLAGEVNHG